MTINAVAGDRLNYPKIAGFFYSFQILLALIPSQLLDMSLILSADDAIRAMGKYEQAYRLGNAIEFCMFMAIMVLSWSLYVVVKPVHKNLATLAFAFRFGEALLGCVVIVFYLMTLTILDSNLDYLAAIPPEQLKALATFFLKMGNGVYYILLTIMGIGAVIYCYLFYISNMIPTVLAVWGIVTYITMIIYGIANIAYTDAPKELAYAMAPGALFEFVIGLWLFFKGVNAAVYPTASNESCR